MYSLIKMIFFCGLIYDENRVRLACRTLFLSHKIRIYHHRAFPFFSFLFRLLTSFKSWRKIRVHYLTQQHAGNKHPVQTRKCGARMHHFPGVSRTEWLSSCATSGNHTRFTLIRRNSMENSIASQREASIVATTYLDNRQGKKGMFEARSFLFFCDILFQT